MAYRTAIFDFDGTIGDPGPAISDSLLFTLKSYGYGSIPIGPHEYIGPPLGMTLKKILPEADPEEALKVFRRHFVEHGLKLYKPYPGIPELLELLSSRQEVSLRIATSKPTGYARSILKDFGLLELFERVVGASMAQIDYSKEILVKEALVGCREPAIMVGDSEHDIAAAKANGIDSVFVAYGCGRFATQPTFIAKDATELKRIILQ